jgi:hypothetical protein
MRTAWLAIPLLAFAACSDDSSSQAHSKTTCQTICDCTCVANADCLEGCNQQCPTYSKACQDCTINVGCEALKGAQGPAPQCASQCSQKTTCQTICDCTCVGDADCLSACNQQCPTYSKECQDCSLGVGCAALKGLQGPAPQCASVCK